MVIGRIFARRGGEEYFDIDGLAEAVSPRQYSPCKKHITLSTPVVLTDSRVGDNPIGHDGHFCQGVP